jgi:plasmid maintenance system antidote protein VapI
MALHGVSFEDLAEWTGRTRGWLSRVANAHDPISPTLAHDISKAFSKNRRVSVAALELRGNDLQGK